MTKYLFLFFFSISILAQQKNYYTEIDPKFKENAFSIINEESLDVKVITNDRYVVKTKKVVTVLNENGFNQLDFTELYNKNQKIKNIQVTIYDANGILQKTFKQKDFRDVSLSSGMNITDNRLLVFTTQTKQFPVVLVYESEVESRNTAFLPKWIPIKEFHQAVIKSTFTVDVPSNIDHTLKLYHDDYFPVDKTTENSATSYQIKNFLALQEESLSPNLNQITPKVLVSLSSVSLEGVKGSFSTWDELGSWYYTTMINGTEELPQTTKNKIQELVNGVNAPIEKAKILYAYMQGKTRYISIQLGLGGWKPMLAKDVDALGYGDCKALTNYMRAMLKVVGVESYPVVLYGSRSSLDIEKESVCLQGNHMILAIPKNDGGYEWVECTDQKSPFGYIAGFTDDRTVLVVKEKGSELVKTKKYSINDNYQHSFTTVDLKENGDVTVDFKIESAGVQFDNRFFTNALDAKDKDKYYRRILSDFKNIQFSSITTDVDKTNIIYKEYLKFSSEKFAQKFGERLVITMPNWNNSNSSLTNARNRIIPFVLNSDWIDQDNIEINIPEGYLVDTLPEDSSINNKYGSYSISFKKQDGKIVCLRIRENKKGNYSKENYSEYKDFIDKTNSIDNSKIVLKKK